MPRKVIDVVGLYLNPPDNALVLSVDEKTQIQFHPPASRDGAPTGFKPGSRRQKSVSDRIPPGSRYAHPTIAMESPSVMRERDLRTGVPRSERCQQPPRQALQVVEDEVSDRHQKQCN